VAVAERPGLIFPRSPEPVTCQPSGTPSFALERPRFEPFAADAVTLTGKAAPGRTSKVPGCTVSPVPSGTAPSVWVSAPSRGAVGAFAAGLPGAGDGTRESTWVKKSQPSCAGSADTSGNPAQPWLAYRRWASRSMAAQVLPCLLEVAPLHTPYTSSAA